MKTANMANIDPGLLPKLSLHLTRHMGLFFPEERWHDLIRGIDAVARDYQFENLDDCVRWLLSAALSREQVESLARSLTVGETYFFRDPAVFEALQTQILPQLIESRRKGSKRLRIWSAGCSTGEEVYSLVILLQRMIPDFDTWDISVLGTDINPNALKKASSGLYSGWSFRNPPSWLQDAYFRKADNDQYEIIPRIRQRATFTYLNLAEEASPVIFGGADIILCRNVLMYMPPQQAVEIISRFRRVMTSEGWLIVSPAEASLVTDDQLTSINLPSQILHRKAVYTPSPMLERPQYEAPQALRLPRTKTIKERPPQSPVVEAANHENDYAMVVSLANRGELDLALGHCEKAMEADRMNPVWHYLLATILQEHEQRDKAVLALKKALYIDQDFVMAHFALGNLYRQQNSNKQALHHLERALQLLHEQGQDDTFPESGDMTAGRLTEMIKGFTNMLEKTA